MSGSLQRKRRVETRIEAVKVKASRANTGVPHRDPRRGGTRRTAGAAA